MIEDKIRSAFPLVTSQGDRDKDKNIFNRFQRKSAYICHFYNQM